MKVFQKYEKKINFVSLILLTLIPISLCFNNNVWLDEAFSIRWSTFPFDEMMGRLVNDVHPPLYYFALRILMFLTGKSLLAAKLFSVTALFLILLAGYRFVQKQFGNKSLYVFWLFTLCTPMMLKKAVEVRMYTWAYLFVLLSFIEMYSLVTNPTKKSWIKYTIFSLCAAYTQYYALITMIFVYGTLLLFYMFSKNWKQVKNWLLCSIVTVAGYIPWLPIAIRQMQGNGAGWIQQPTSRLGLIRELFYINVPKSDSIYVVMILIAMSASFILFLKNKDGISYWTLAGFVPLWGCMFLGLVYGELYKPILISRYLMIPLCVLIVAFSSMFQYVPKLITIVICVFFVIVGCMTYRIVFNEEYNTLTEETLQFAEENIDNEDIIVTDAGALASVIPYYFPLSKSVNDIYTDEYDSAWYFDNSGCLDIKYLECINVKAQNYGYYGLDNVYFTIYHLEREE